jgi:hypothetical protein
MSEDSAHGKKKNQLFHLRSRVLMDFGASIQHRHPYSHMDDKKSGMREKQIL